MMDWLHPIDDGSDRDNKGTVISVEEKHFQLKLKLKDEYIKYSHVTLVRITTEQVVIMTTKGCFKITHDCFALIRTRIPETIVRQS